MLEQKSETFDPDAPLLVACRRFAREVDAFDERVSRALGLGRSDLRAVNLLEGGPRSHVEIARALGLSRAAVTALVDRLEGAGVARRGRFGTDRRRSSVELEPAVWRRLAEVYRPMGERVLGVAAGLPEAQRAALADAVDAIADAFAGANRGAAPEMD